jgi:superfamily II DNA/RNA helicase
MENKNFSDKIFELESFQRQLKTIRINSVRVQFSKLIIEEEQSVIPVDWNNVLSCASVLSTSEKMEHLDSALRVAQTCLLSSNTNESQKYAAAFILEKLTNKPAIELAIKRQLLNANYFNEVPLPLQLSITKNNYEYSIIGQNESVLYLNRFQKEVYDLSKVVDLLSISAPTSSGKSFILSQIIFETLHEGKVKSIFYLVPTRALISQVEDDFRDIVKRNNLSNIFITSVPQISEEDAVNSSRIFVFTQERLHWFRNENPKYKIDFVIIDEAHKIADGSRGILMLQKIEELVKDFPAVKIYFSSPFTSNPQKLLEKISLNKRKEPIKKDFVAVNQNLIFVSQKSRKPKEWEVSLCSKNGNVKLGELLLSFAPNPDTKKLPFLAHALGDSEGGNIIYVNGAAAAEKAALQLYDLVEHQNTPPSPDILELNKLIKKIIHSKYKLVTVLTRGIAFHYGNMPLTVRQEIERLFKLGQINYLVCTSTLMEGVNLPAKSIFIRNPKRGKSNPLSDSDFWNLAGRAGRWGKEFQGNVICIAPEEWEKKPTLENREQEIKIAIDEILVEKKELLEFIRANAPREAVDKKQSLEYAFTYLYEKYLKNELESTLKNRKELFEDLVVEFDKISKTITIPNSIVFKNSGISVIAQQNLYSYFDSFTEDFEQLIPDYPQLRDAVNHSYLFIVQTISKYLSGDPVALAFPHAILVVNWMKGYTLSSLIDNSYKYWKTQGKTIDWTIRETMRDVEEYARFKFAKYSSCYVDILRYFLKTKGLDNLADSIPQLNMWLEFGVSQQTQLSLIALGLSRSSAISISELIANDELGQKDCLKWLANPNLEMLGLSPIVIAEIRKVIGGATEVSQDDE